MVRAPHLVIARSRTPARGSRMTSGIAAAIAATSFDSTRRPDWASTTSGMPPRANATTGVPHANASATTRQYGSSHNGVTRAAAAPPTSDARRFWSRCPA